MLDSRPWASNSETWLLLSPGKSRMRKDFTFVYLDDLKELHPLCPMLKLLCDMRGCHTPHPPFPAYQEEAAICLPVRKNIKRRLKALYVTNHSSSACKPLPCPVLHLEMTQVGDGLEKDEGAAARSQEKTVTVLLDLL